MQLTSCVSPAILASRERSLSRWPPSADRVGANEVRLAAGTAGTGSPEPHGDPDGTGGFWVGGEGKMPRSSKCLWLSRSLPLFLGRLCHCFVVPFCGWKYRSVCRKMEGGVSMGYMIKNTLLLLSSWRHGNRLLDCFTG